MGATLSTRRSIACPKSYGMCVAAPHGLVIVFDHKAKQLHMYSLIDGTMIRSIGSQGNGKGQFDSFCSGLCVSTDGDSVLVAERYNNRVQEVRIADGSWVRFAGESVLKWPEFVDCNADVIVVSESTDDRISMLSWADGNVLARFGSNGCGSGQLCSPRGVRLLADGSKLVVADCWNNRLCLFTLSGEFVAAAGSSTQGLNNPCDVLLCVRDGGFVVSNFGSHNFVKMGWDGVNVGVYDRHGSGDGTVNYPTALAALPNDGYLVASAGNQRVQQFVSWHAKLAWMRACVSCIV
jgi:DNA-binding beta-propeller fold protein YncE